MTFSEQENMACRRLIELALEEDLGRQGDLTSQALIPPELMGSASFVARGVPARSADVVAGLPAVALVLEAIDSALVWQPMVEDGALLASPGMVLARVSGPMQGILAAERTALNFLQRLSGIASLTRKYVEAVASLPCQILDTRKTTPGWRLLEKYAVRCGGGHNHRLGLHDGILIKDNHLAALGDGLAAIGRAIETVRQKFSTSLPLEIEVENLEQFGAALSRHPDIILLDNMDVAKLREAVKVRDEVAPKVKLEASGGITLHNVRAIAETGVDRISIGALTHSAAALDIALDYLGNID